MKDSNKRDYRDLFHGAGLIVVGIALFLIALLVFGSMWVFGYGAFTDATANRQGETQKKHQVEGNGSYRIAAYDHFFDLCASVQAAEDKIQAQKDELDGKPAPDAQRADILRANINALSSTRAESIRQYNQDARKSYTLGQFKSSDLPFQLDIHAKETSCTAD